MVPREVTLALLEADLPGLEAWAHRHACRLDVDREGLSLKAFREPVVVTGALDGYRALPPVWTVTNTHGADLVKKLSASKSPPPGVTSSIFHGSGVICAPFSRLAYKENKGPHGDWGGMANWLNAGAPNDVRATTIGDMLQVIWLHLTYAKAFA
ncbi:MAG: hypothetical protein M9894_17655 [Planctomycetes bacterium]|nr:hypothetical protein [Planctomycetota bacterium]